MPAHTTVVVAHRGASADAPQNTLAAFDAAGRAGAAMIEIDVHLSADGVPVVIHDGTVDATTDGTGEVRGHTRAELQALDAGSWFGPEFTGQRVPTLAEVLELVARHQGLGVLCEYKGAWAAADVAVTMRVMTGSGLEDRIMVQGFDPTTVAALRDVAPQVPRSLLVEHPRDDLPALLAELDAVAVSPGAGLIADDPRLVPAAHAAGLQVFGWTANDEPAWRLLVDAGVDGIITDRPAALRDWLDTAAVPARG
ncbi:glycerophosphodiester phosphodiesterase [Krasilnikoviella flava]|uniref:Glycerophosphoryl diester phosphodiesterase n=1 Tax=Krasilnikoviella flava TaxID=526729 RepID=A0A1T5LH91_9MICO|nr:glycerophosphodiester phosphodiesterase family protein [Krasilnikoviella flava]SKC75392.1 glycerophosphoryl diester phosphodiesterase [Krasilnikoviella flava]